MDIDKTLTEKTQYILNTEKIYINKVFKLTELTKQYAREQLILHGVSKCCNCDETIINESYCECCYDLANSRDNT